MVARWSVYSIARSFMAKQRIVIVTGGGSGMGRAIARRFADAGDKVYVLGRRLEKLQETGKGFPGIECLATDVTDTNSVENARDAIIKKHKNIDVLVNNAGGTFNVSPDVDLDEAAENWNELIKTNLNSVFYMIFALEKYMSRPGGRIINITSVAALAGSSRPGIGGQGYAASKAGIHGLSRTLMPSLAADGITINCIAPGLIGDTEFFGETGLSEDRREYYLKNIPVHRVGKSEDVAKAAFYLASDEAGFVTGEILNVNGGAQFGR